MKDFAAIDFETANGNPSSVCSVGVVVVRGGEVAEKVYRLIRPAPNYYSPGNVRVHGLTRRDTDPHPHFPEVWGAIAPLIEGLPLVAHFSRFDEGCLRAAFSRYGLDWPDYTFYCTCTASRRVLGSRLPNHKLDTVATYLGFPAFRHHEALADAEACAHIAVRLLPRAYPDFAEGSESPVCSDGEE